MKLLAQKGGENMSDKIYNGKIKSVETMKYGFGVSVEFCYQLLVLVMR